MTIKNINFAPLANQMKDKLDKMRVPTSYVTEYHDGLSFVYSAREGTVTLDFVNAHFETAPFLSGLHITYVSHVSETISHKSFLQPRYMYSAGWLKFYDTFTQARFELSR